MQPVPEDFHTEVRSYIAHTNSYGFVGVIYVITIIYLKEKKNKAEVK